MKYIKSIFIIVLISLPLIFHVWRKNQYFSLSARVTRLRGDIAKREEEIAKIQKVYYQVTSPVYIESLAVLMGFKYPKKNEKIILRIKDAK